MRTVLERRASSVLYHLLLSQEDSRGVVLLPANCCPVLPLTVSTAGRRFEFIDIDPRTLAIDPMLLESRLAASETARVSAIVFVRTYGFIGDASPLFRRIKRSQPGILLVDDRCAADPALEATGDEFQGSDVLLYSTGYSKPIDLGWGGFAHLGECRYARHDRAFSEEDLERVTARYQRCIRRGQTLPPGLGSSPGGENWLECRPPVIDWRSYSHRVDEARKEALATRRRINEIYRSEIPRRCQLPEGFHDWRFQILVPRGPRLLERIAAAGLFASSHYYPASRLFLGESCPVADRLHGYVVNLFNDRRYTEGMAVATSLLVREHLAKFGERSSVSLR